jgi:hypothetical protein
MSCFPPLARALRAAALCGLLTPALAAAQAAAAEPSSASRRGILQTASTNPFAAPFGFVSAEYERALGTRGLAIGVGGLTTFSSDPQVLNDGGSQSFRSLQVKLKYYPRQDGLRGFALGITAGVAHERELAFATYMYGPRGELLYSEEVTRARTAPTLGTTLDYNLFIGKQRRFLVGLGVGARRSLGSRGDSGPLDGAILDPRLQFGFGF